MSIIHKITYVYYKYIKFALKIFIYKMYNVYIAFVSKVYMMKIKWLWYYGSDKCILNVCKVIMVLHALIHTILKSNN